MSRPLALAFFAATACGDAGQAVDATDTTGTETHGETGSDDDVPDPPDDPPPPPPEVPDPAPMGDPGVPGATLPAYGTDCSFVGQPRVAFGPVESEYTHARLGPCGHLLLSDAGKLLFPDGEIIELPPALAGGFAVTGELGLAQLSDSEFVLVDLVTRNQRTLSFDAPVETRYVPSFVDGVHTRVLTCGEGRIDVHDASGSWFVAEGIDNCRTLEVAEAAPILHYFQAGLSRIVNLDTGFTVTLAIAPAGQGCHRNVDLGYDGDLIWNGLYCSEEQWVDDIPEIVDVLVSGALYSTKSGELERSIPGERYASVPLRGGAWYFRHDYALEAYADGQLVKLFDPPYSYTVAGDSVLAIVSKEVSGVYLGAVLRSIDGGGSFTEVDVREAGGALSSNWEGNAIGIRGHWGIEQGADLWTSDNGSWVERATEGLHVFDVIFADGTSLLRVANQGTRTTVMRSATGELLRSWPEGRRSKRLDDRAVMYWPESQFSPAGVELIDAEGTTIPLVPEGSEPQTVEVAPMVGFALIEVADGNVGQELYWGRL